MNTKILRCLLYIYFGIALLLSPISIYHMDSFYYWDWSRHLALSYYDGSPLIAYIVRLSTFFFADTLFALGTVAVGITALTSWVLFKTARLFLNQEASCIALLLWLFSPLTTLDILHQVTYDTPQALFWAICLYFALRFIKQQRTADVYYIGISAGLLLLSKYTGIVLLLAMVLFLMITPYRRLFKSTHFYLSCLIIFIISSPILIWNYQHQWVSFIYQLNIHHQLKTLNASTHTSAAWSMMQAITRYYLPFLNALLIAPAICLYNKYYKSSQMVSFCLTISVFFLAFYCLLATKAEIRPNWLAPYLISSALLAGYCYQKQHLKKATHYLIGAYVLISFSIIVLNNPFISLSRSKKIANYQLIKQFNQDHSEKPPYVFTSDWIAARPLFFLKNQPLVYTLPCQVAVNQYGIWSKKILPQINNKTIKRALYISVEKGKFCADKYFDQCRRLPTRPYYQGQRKHEIFAYQCINYS